ncbi:anti-repressor SinI family protein [Peribacillus simplex]|uniref:Anti-repressor SinI n=1 Tax=Peribacillus simplex TaxID=1478 RepID=A0A9X8R8M3_9BACI|nr:anti-repressor SinI family protein [Peribacillus simplex]WHY57473.1 anti-repressor SinI family protein [Peribacillus simplex]SIR08648.1 Anti-repressor SinI [Peribacillus simplex]
MKDFEGNLPAEWLDLVTLAMKSDVTKEQFKKFLQEKSNSKKSSDCGG